MNSVIATLIAASRARAAADGFATTGVASAVVGSLKGVALLIGCWTGEGLTTFVELWLEGVGLRSVDEAVPCEATSLPAWVPA